MHRLLDNRLPIVWVITTEYRGVKQLKPNNMTNFLFGLLLGGVAGVLLMWEVIKWIGRDEEEDE